MEGLWKMRALGGRDVCVPPFKMPTLNTKTLCPEDTMRDGYRPKMLLFALDELFYIYSQVKNLRRADEKFTLYYKAVLNNYRYIYRNEDGAALQPHWLRGPPTLSPVCAPLQQSLVVTLAPVGSNAQGSSCGIGV